MQPPKVDITSQPTQLRANELFAPGTVPIHINTPVHSGDTPLHDHDFFEIALVESGHAVHRDVHGVRPVAAGSLILVQPGQWHAYEACRTLHLTNVVFAARLLHRECAWAVDDGHLAAIAAPRNDIHIAEFTTSQLTTLRAHISVLAQQPSYDEQHRVGLVALLMLILAEASALTQDQAGTSGEGRLPDPLREVLKAIDADLARDWRLDELATIAGMDQSYLSRLMRRHLGSSPVAWLNRRRLERAAVMLLTTDTNISDICQQVGYPDANYFARKFRSAFGQSPSEYRKQLPMPANASLADSWIQW